MPTTRYISYHNRRRRRRKTIFMIFFMIVLLAVAALFTWIAVKNFKREQIPESSLQSDILSDPAVTAKEPSSTESMLESEPWEPSDEEASAVAEEESSNASNLAWRDYSTPLPAGEAVTDAYFDDAVFIGDSRTQGFILYTGLANTTAYADKGASVESVFTKDVIASGDKKIPIMDALAANKTFKKVYLMLGVNELGWAYSNVFQDKYREIVQKIKEINPDAEIYVQSILPVSKKKSDGDKIYNNEKIKSYNQLIQDVAADEQVYYLDVAKAVENEDGVLPEDASADGVHMNKAYCQKWLEYLKTHTAQGFD